MTDNQLKYLTGLDVLARAKGAVTYNRIRTAIANGDLFAQKIGQSYVIQELEADRWLAQCAEQDKPVLPPVLQRIKELEAKVLALGGEL